jgi:hypothetical protein
MITKDYQYLDTEINSIEQKEKISFIFELRKNKICHTSSVSLKAL